MDLTETDIKKWSAHWIYESKDALKSAEELFTSKRYHHALFFAHLAVEKKIKAYFLKKHKTFPPPVHDLILLVKKAELSLDDKTLMQLEEINTFNIRARYDDYKLEFYKKATPEYAKKWIEITENLLNIFSEL